MRRLTLLRHAKSSWRERGLPDHDRPLAKRGRRDAPHMGERLRDRGAVPGLILTSSAKRARATAELVAEALDAEERLEIEPDLYLASPAQMLGIVARQAPDVSELVLVGHNPGLTMLANQILPSLGLANLPTAGVVAIDFPGERWDALEIERAELAYYDYPKNPAPVVNPN